MRSLLSVPWPWPWCGHTLLDNYLTRYNGPKLSTAIVHREPFLFLLHRTPFLLNSGRSRGVSLHAPIAFARLESVENRRRGDAGVTKETVAQDRRFALNKPTMFNETRTVVKQESANEASMSLNAWAARIILITGETYRRRQLSLPIIGVHM